MYAQYITHSGSDKMVSDAARVSFANHDWTAPLTDKDAGLIDFLARHNHKSPFNHCFLTLECEAPVYLARQLQKHEYMPWNEESKRYRDVPPTFHDQQMRKRAKNVKQGSTDDAVTLDGFWQIKMMEAKENYQFLLDQGVAPECARAVLPQSMNTRWVWSGTLFAFCKMINLRDDSHAQREAQDFAKMVAAIVSKHFPLSYKALCHDHRNN